MRHQFYGHTWGIAAVLIAVGVLFAAGGAGAAIPGITGPTFNLTAKSGFIYGSDGSAIYMWGYADGAAWMQYPGPTLLVNQGEMVSVTLTNELTVPVSILFPGQSGVTASGGTLGIFTQEAPPLGGTVTYTFTAGHPGTFQYFSGTDSRLQTEMGLVGALIVRPPVALQAYDHPATAFDREFLFVETELDPILHWLVEIGFTYLVDWSAYFPTYYFLNGRNSPDTMAEVQVPWLPSQPYNCMPMMHPGETILLRIVNAGRDFHPFHTHGHFMTIIAQDGRLRESAPGLGPDVSYQDFTHTVPPGGTADALFSWDGAGLGWDIYGHLPGDSLAPNESALDHGKPMPVTLPGSLEVTYGTFYPGSPYLGSFGFLPPGLPAVNDSAAYFYMFHSHREKDMTSDGVFPGGMMTMLMIHPPDMEIME